MQHSVAAAADDEVEIAPALRDEVDSVSGAAGRVHHNVIPACGKSGDYIGKRRFNRAFSRVRVVGEK